jgi:hypothetical protein
MAPLCGSLRRLFSARSPFVWRPHPCSVRCSDPLFGQFHKSNSRKYVYEILPSPGPLYDESDHASSKPA